MNYRFRLIRIFTFLGGIYFFLQYVLPAKLGPFTFGKYHEEISNGFILMGAMAVGLGLINLLMVHGSRLVFRRTGWVNSAALLLAMALMIVITAADWLRTQKIAAQAAGLDMLAQFSRRISSDYQSQRTDVLPFWERNRLLLEAGSSQLAVVYESLEAAANLAGRSTDPALKTRLSAGLQETAAHLKETESLLKELELESSTASSMSPNEDLARALGRLQVSWRELLGLQYASSITRKVYDFLYQGLFMSLGAAMFALLGFYIASAAYRAFRLRSAESGLMMAAALVVMLGQIPLGVWIWYGFPELRLWLLQIPSTAASRAIEMGAAIAGLVMAFRMWFSIEPESFR